MTNIASQEKRERWRDRIYAQLGSGLSISKWCDTKGIHKSQFYYWKNALMDLDPKYFIEVKESAASLKLEYRGVHIFLEKDSDPRLVRQGLVLIKEALC